VYNELMAVSKDVVVIVLYCDILVYCEAVFSVKIRFYLSFVQNRGHIGQGWIQFNSVLTTSSVNRKCQISSQSGERLYA
jgi:hypothetical protein